MDEEWNTANHLAAFAGEKGDGNEKNVYGLTPKDITEYLGLQGQGSGVPIFRTKRGKLDLMSPEEFENHFGVKYLDHLSFKNGKILQKVLRKTARKGYDLEKENAWNCALYLEQWKKRAMPEILLKWVNPLIGYGIFAKNDIPALSYIGEYTGIIRRRKRLFKDRNNYVFGYVIGHHETPYVIDAEKNGNFTRFLNHADEPNLTSRWLIADGMCHIIFYANRLIPQGEQLTYDYGPLYWKHRPTPVVI